MTTGIDFRAVSHCSRCGKPHPVVRFHQHATPLATEHGYLTHWYECCRTQQQVAVRGEDYPASFPEHVRAVRARRIA